MGFERIPGTEAEYGLISFDAEGRERLEGTTLMSARLLEKASKESVTNVFFFCHGWKGDLPAARDQYNLWMKALLDSADRKRAGGVFPGFSPLLMGLHWPSLPWGDEELGDGGSFAGDGGVSPEWLLKAYLERLGNRAEIRKPLELILEVARKNSAPDFLPKEVRQAYLELNDALGLKSEGAGAAPDADRQGFDPELSYQAANEEGSAGFGGYNLGGILGPLRQLSYWTMKKRARTVGESGMHVFLKNLQDATAGGATRIHLMGHSFGTIVVSGMLGGPDSSGTLPRPVDSAVLVQGAVSLWSYAPSIPFERAGAGYFSRIFVDKKVSGPLVTTKSKHDTAVGKLYPLASRVKGAASFPLGKEAPTFPEFGAIGAFGLQGISDAKALEMRAVTDSYPFQKGKLFNLEASKYIAKMEGASGAHNDIGGPEVAHAIWEAAFASV